MKTTTPDEDNDTIRAIVDEVFPAPLGGFENEADEHSHKAAADRLFIILSRRWPADPSAEIAAMREVCRMLIEEAEAFGFDSVNVNCVAMARAALKGGAK